MAVGDKSHLNNYQRAATPVIVNPNSSPMSFSGAASVPNTINPFEATKGNSMNFSGTNTVTQLLPDVARTENGMTVPVTTGTSSVFDYSMPSGDDRSAYEKAMADRYASTLVSPGINIFGTDIGKQYGYTGQGSQSMAGINAPSNTNPGGGSVSGGGSRAQSTGPAPIPEVLISQDLSQRTPSGSVYAPDLSAYNDSSLFNYTGPGGVDEYTYGQGLRTGGADYSIFGSPADIANPYYEGQFAPITQTAPVGPADGAIGMSPIQLPSDLPQIEISSDVSMPAFNGLVPRPPGSAGDLTYQQTIDEMGIFGPDNPPPSTTFPSPGDNTGLTQNMTSSDKEYQDMLNQSLMMDNQLMNQLDSSDPRGGEAELNQNVGKLPQDSSMADNQAQADMAMGDRAGYQDSERLLARDVAAGMADNLETLMEQGTRLQTMYDVAEGRQRAGERENLLQNQDVEAANYQRALDAQKIELDKQRYNTQINNPTADFSGYMRNYGSGFKEPAPVNADASQAELDKARYNAQISNPTADFSGYMRNYGSGFVEPQASISDVTDATPMQFANNAGQMEASNANIFNEGKTGPSGKNATDVKIENADKIIENLNRPFREQENTSLFSSFNPIDIALRLASGGDVTENAIAAHRANKEGDFGDGLKYYKDENLQMLDGSIYQPVSDATDGYHFRSGKDAGKLSGSQDLTLGGLPMAAGSWLYQQANGLLDGTLGSNANKQAIDNMQGLIASGNAPAVKTLFDNVAAGKARDENIKKSIDDGTFKPGVKAPAKEAEAAKKAESAKKAAAKAKAKAEAQAKAKAEQARSKAAAKAKAEAAAKAKAKKEADEAARKARENARKPTPAPKKVKVSYNRNKPTPVKKSKPAGRGPQPSRPTRTTGSRGGRGNVGARRRLTGGR